MDTERHEPKSEQVGGSFEISVGRCSMTDEMPTEVLVVTDAVLRVPPGRRPVGEMLQTEAA